MSLTTTRTVREARLEELVDALDRLLVHYRMGRRPSGALLDRIARLKFDLGLTHTSPTTR